MTFDLFDKLGATEEQLDFPIVYASGLSGYAGLDADVRENMAPLFETILQHVPVRSEKAMSPYNYKSPRSTIAAMWV